MSSNSDRFITEWERKQLLSELHTRLFWVGEKIPYFVEINGKKCKLHERIWDLINQETISEDEKKQIEIGIDLLRDIVKAKELDLQTKELTVKEANDLANEAAGLLRAIMDLREIEDGISIQKQKEFHYIFSTQRTEEIRRWLDFLKSVKKN